MPQMSEQTLKGILAAKIASAVGFVGGSGTDSVSKDRLNAEKYYKGEPFGNEEEGRSQVVSRDVAEAVDALMPPLLKMFTSGDKVVEFQPVGQEDEEAAKQATDYVNYIWTQENPAFLVFHSWFKDALLKRLGTVKIWWEENERVQKTSFEGLDAMQMQALELDPDVEIVEKEERDDPSAPAMAEPDPAPMPGSGGALAAPAKVYDVKIARRQTIGGVKVRPVPPDELLYDRRLVMEDDCPFIAHRRKRTLSDLIEDGYDKAQVMGLGGDDDGDLNQETTERFTPEDEIGFRDDGTLDPTMREVWVTECYARVDYDGDGVAEYRKITVAGEGSVIEVLKREGEPDNEEVDDHPFASLTPLPMPHKLAGMSIADKTMDLQLVKSVLWRQALDSLYIANAPMIGAVEGQVNLDDAMNRRPGGIVRLKSPEGLVPIPTVQVAPDAYQMIAYVDSVREQRTGVRRFTAGPGADALNNAYTDTATGVNAVEDSSDEMILFFARVFAETGVKRAFKRTLKLVCEHQTKPKMIRLRNEWVPMDPRFWNADMDMTVAVGLGTGNKAQQIATMMNLLTLDQQIVAMQGGPNGPLVTLPNIYKKLEKLVEASDLKSVDPYYSDPAKAPPQPPKPPSPEEVKAQAEVQKMQLEAHLKQQQAQTDLQMKQAELQLKRQEAEMAMALRQQEFQMEMQMAAAKFQQQMQHDQMMGAVKVEQAHAAGQQKLDFAAQAAEQRAAAAKSAPQAGA